jgi:NitT/TauT family transport system permease protein
MTLTPRKVRWLLIVAVLVALEALTRGGVIDDLVLPPPTRLVSAIWDMLGSDTFGADLGRTVLTLALSSLIGVVGGLGLGALCWKSQVLGDVLAPYLSALYAMPTLVFYPVLVALLGLGLGPITVIATFMVLAPVTLYTMVGLRAIDPVLTKMGHSMNCTPRQLLSKVLLPAATPLVVPGIKLGFIYGMIGTIAMEFMLSSQGLGFRIGDRYNNFEIPNMWAAIVVVTFLTVAVSSLLTRVETRIRRDML